MTTRPYTRPFHLRTLSERSVILEIRIPDSPIVDRWVMLDIDDRAYLLDVDEAVALGPSVEEAGIHVHRALLAAGIEPDEDGEPL